MWRRSGPEGDGDGRNASSKVQIQRERERCLASSRSDLGRLGLSQCVPGHGEFISLEVEGIGEARVANIVGARWRAEGWP